MKDIELLDIIFSYLYAKNGCEDIQKTVSETNGIKISADECLRLFKLIISTGFVKELNYVYGPHIAIVLNDSGYQMMLQHGSYSAFVNSKKKEKDRIADEKYLEQKNLELEVDKKTIERKYKPWEITFAIIGGLCALIVLIEYVIKAIKWLVQ
jgi:hypothetical protein